MTDREKVIAAYICQNEKLPDKRCEKCQYGYEYLDQTCDNYFVWCNTERIMADAIDLLKTYEPQGTPEAEWLLYKGMIGATCSYCKHTFDDVYDVENYDYYCRHCGAKMIRMRTVKWK